MSPLTEGQAAYQGVNVGHGFFLLGWNTNDNSTPITKPTMYWTM
jgi:hypothetical protein